jgi:hypothetical protein
MVVAALLCVAPSGGAPALPPLPPALPGGLRHHARLRSPKDVLPDGHQVTETAAVAGQAVSLPLVRVGTSGQIEMLRLVQVDDSTLKLLAIAPYGAGWRLESSSNLVQWFDLGELETVACLELTTNELVMSQQTIAASWPAGNWTNQSDRTGYSWPAGGWTNGPEPKVYFRLRVP